MISLPEGLFPKDFAKSEVKVYLLAHLFTNHSWHDGWAWSWLSWKGNAELLPLGLGKVKITVKLCEPHHLSVSHEA